MGARGVLPGFRSLAKTAHGRPVVLVLSAAVDAYLVILAVCSLTGPSELVWALRREKLEEIPGHTVIMAERLGVREWLEEE